MFESKLTKFTARCHFAAISFMIVTFVLGVLLRMQWFLPVEGFPFAYVVHAHSHVGFLGWVFNGFFMIASQIFILEEDEAWFRRLFWLCQFVVLGMLVAFPMQGYGLWSIIFSTIHLLGSIAFVIRLMRRNRAGPAAFFALKIAGVFLLLSSAGPFAMGPIMVTSLRYTIWHDLGIYYYLHFQYNAWFVFFLIAAVFQMWERRFAGVDLYRIRGYLVLLAVSIILTYSQSALWLGLDWIGWLAGVGGGLQLYSTIRLIVALRAQGPLFHRKLSEHLAWCAGGLFVLKVILQLIAVVPVFSNLGEQHYVVIAFLHLIFLGVTTPLIWAWAVEFGYLRENRLLKTGIGLFAIGVIVSQLAIIYLPVSGSLSWEPLPYVFSAIFFASVVILLGGVAIAVNSFKIGSVD